MYLAYPISAFFAQPDWMLASSKRWYRNSSRSGVIRMMVGLIGTTITPGCSFIFRRPSSKKEFRQKDYRLARWDVVLGCIVTDVVAFFIVVACAATLFKSGHGEIHDRRGSCPCARAVGWEVRGAPVRLRSGERLAAFRRHLPLATAYNVCEGLVSSHGVESGFRRRQYFMRSYTLPHRGRRGVRPDSEEFLF